MSNLDNLDNRVTLNPKISIEKKNQYAILTEDFLSQERFLSYLCDVVVAEGAAQCVEYVCQATDERHKKKGIDKMRRLFMMIATASLCIAAALSSYATPTAFWTGGGDRSNVNDPANWAVTNSLGEAVANAVPDADTAVVVSGETDFNCPLGQTLTCKSFTVGDCKLTADCDWRGLVIQPSSPAYIDVPNGAYIDTGFKPNQNTRVVMDVTVQDTREYWCGVWDTTDWHNRAFAFGNDNTGVYTAFVKTGKSNNGTTGALVANGRHVLDFDKGVFKVDGATHTSRSAGGEVYQWIYPLYLFAQNRTGSAFAHGDQGTIRFHSCQIYDNGTLVRDYIPAKNGTTFGLYDKVGGAFAALAGSGAGLVGGIVAAGELHIDAYGIIENTTLAIDGTLTLVKEGTGTFTATKAGQSYTGGTVVNSGWAKCGVADRPWGAALSLVTIHDGATFDWAGAFTQTGSAYDFAIEGSGTDGNGALVSTGVRNSYHVSTIANLELLGDARIGGRGGWGFANVNGSWPGHTLTMNGHTLSISLQGDGTKNTGMFAFAGVTTSGSGTIAFVDAMSSRVFPSFFQSPSDLSSVTLDLGDGYSINIEQATTVGTFIDRMNSTPEDLAKKSPITVVDTFKPKATKLVRTVTLGDSTHLSPVLDLSELDAPFVLPSSGYTMDMASGAKVQIKLGDRSKTSKTPIITWTDVKPSWINNLKFTRGDNGKNYSIVVKEDGIYVVIGMTLTIR